LLIFDVLELWLIQLEVTRHAFLVRLFVCPMLRNALAEYKFTCVCVYVSVTLSINSPTGQTPQRNFTVDSLKDADSCKDVPFGVSMMNNHIYGSKVPHNPHFGGLNRHFKPNMLKNSNSYIFRYYIYQIDMKFESAAASNRDFVGGPVWW